MITLDKEKLAETLTAHALGRIEEGTLGHAEILVNRNGERIFDGVFGYSDYAAGTLLRKGAVFRAASMTKPVTAFAVLKAESEGLLSLNDPVYEYLPGFRDMYVGGFDGDRQPFPVKKATGVIRIFNLLCHTSGIGSGKFAAYQAPLVPKTSLADIADFYAGQLLDFDPYLSQAYSPTGAFDVAARIVETVSGKPFDVYLDEILFGPLGMKDTTFKPDGAQWKRFPQMHARTKDGRPCEEKMNDGCVFGDVPAGVCSGGGGLASTAEDYMRFAEMLLHRGRTPDGDELLPYFYVKKMLTPHVPESIMNASFRWGLGGRVIVKSSVRSLPIGSYGWSGAYGSHFWIDPENGISAVYMKNSVYDGGAGCRTANEFEKDVCALG